MPSSDTIRIVAGNIDAAYFYWAVIQSMEALVNDVYNAFAGQGNEPEIFQWMVRKAGGQKGKKEKTNEIPASRTIMPYVPTFDRNQMIMCSWDSFVDAESIARLVDVFVDSLDLSKYGIKEASEEGRPLYEPNMRLSCCKGNSA